MSSSGSTSPQTARTVRCDRCGAPILVQQLAPAVLCGHCGYQQPLDPQLVAGLQRYRQQVGHELDAAAALRAQAQALRVVEQQARQPGKKRILLIGLVIGGPPRLSPAWLGGMTDEAAVTLEAEWVAVLGAITVGTALAGGPAIDPSVRYSRTGLLRLGRRTLYPRQPRDSPTRRHPDTYTGR